MKVFICLDDKGGRLFNNRRQSRDSAVTEDILNYVDGEPVFMNEYSKKLFPDTENAVVYTAVPNDGFLFSETEDVFPLLPCIDTFFLYRWNRIYPSDTAFTVDLSCEGFSLQNTTEFVGTSHEKITREVWSK